MDLVLGMQWKRLLKSSGREIFHKELSDALRDASEEFPMCTVFTISVGLRNLLDAREFDPTHCIRAGQFYFSPLPYIPNKGLIQADPCIQYLKFKIDAVEDNLYYLRKFQTYIDEFGDQNWDQIQKSTKEMLYTVLQNTKSMRLQNQQILETRLIFAKQTDPLKKLYITLQ